MHIWIFLDRRSTDVNNLRVLGVLQFLNLISLFFNIYEFLALYKTSDTDRQIQCPSFRSVTFCEGITSTVNQDLFCEVTVYYNKWFS